MATSTPFDPPFTSSPHPQGQGHVKRSRSEGIHGNENGDGGLVAEDDCGTFWRENYLHLEI